MSTPLSTMMGSGIVLAISSKRADAVAIPWRLKQFLKRWWRLPARIDLTLHRSSNISIRLWETTACFFVNDIGKNDYFSNLPGWRIPATSDQSGV
jgi:hypothetical protein